MYNNPVTEDDPYRVNPDKLKAQHEHNKQQNNYIILELVQVL
jgi:hypothetical protein